QLSDNMMPVPRPASPVAMASLWAALALLWIFLLLPLVGWRENMSERLADTLFVVELASLVFSGLCAALAAFFFAIPDHHKRPTERILAALSLGIWLVLVLHCLVFATKEEALEEFQRFNPGFYCTTTVIGLGLIPAVFGVILLRRLAPTQPVMTSFLVILAAFTFGVFGCRLHHGDVPMYILIWQYAPAFFAALIAALLGNKLLRW
ncbi:MAG: DUF1109 family protein, partial [Rickettsiales bacterium]|nr:DUF1109 family protein [Rickettsiales bacterium]